jgi:hypothetical protein
MIDESLEVMTNFKGSPALDAGLLAAARSSKSLSTSPPSKRGWVLRLPPSIGPCGSATGSRKTTAVLAQHHRPGDTRRLIGQCYGYDPRPMQHGSTDIGGIVLLRLTYAFKSRGLPQKINVPLDRQPQDLLLRLMRPSYFARLHTASALVPVEVAGLV